MGGRGSSSGKAGRGAGGKQSKKLVEVTQETKALTLLEPSNSKENIAVIGKKAVGATGDILQKL